MQSHKVQTVLTWYLTETIDNEIAATREKGVRSIVEHYWQERSDLVEKSCAQSIQVDSSLDSVNYDSEPALRFIVHVTVEFCSSAFGTDQIRFHALLVDRFRQALLPIYPDELTMTIDTHTIGIVE